MYHVCYKSMVSMFVVVEERFYMVHGRSLAGPHDTVGGGVGHMGI